MEELKEVKGQIGYPLMREFKILFEDLGYTFQSADVLEDVYQFFRYYDNDANKGVTAILLEGDPGSGKTFLSEIFFQFLGENTEYLYTQCVEETNSDKLINTYNVPAIVKGQGDLAVAEGILTKAINDANSGKKVVLTIDELDKARETLDAYFLDFLQNGRIETMDNKTLELTPEGRKRIFVIFAKNDEREVSEAFKRRANLIKLPPMPPVLAYKTLLKNFEGMHHDPKFLKFICKVYEAIYNEQMENNGKFLRRLPALQELTTAITGDHVLYESGVNSSRRISSLIRKLGKDDQAREKITNLMVKKFKYQQMESNYNNETLDLDMSNPNEYMTERDPNSLIDQYVQKKDSGEIIFEEDDLEDPMKDIANILDNMKDDSALVFIDRENKEKIVELGVISHKDPRAIDQLFGKIRFKGNPNSRFGFLDTDGDNFIAIVRHKGTLILVANKEYVSPYLLMRGLSTIITIIYDDNENIDIENQFFFSRIVADEFKLTGLNAKVLSRTPKLVLDKMRYQNGHYTYNDPNLKITYDDTLNSSYFRYMQKYKAEPLYKAIENLCRFNPELALPASFINGKRFNAHRHKNLIKKMSKFEKEKAEWERMRLDGWEVKIDNFMPMSVTTMEYEPAKNSWNDDPEYKKVEGNYVFEWVIERNDAKKSMHVYPKYYLKNDFLMYTSDEDFENDEYLQQLDPFQKEIAYVAREVFGNFVLDFSAERNPAYFSSLTMSQTGRIVDDPDNRQRIPGIRDDITETPAFANYYNSISQVSALMTSEKALKKVVKKLWIRYPV